MATGDYLAVSKSRHKRRTPMIRLTMPRNMMPRPPLSSLFAVLFAVMSCGILCGLSTSARAADSASGDVVLRALREEMDRSKANLKLENVPAPYYIEYRVT